MVKELDLDIWINPVVITHVNPRVCKDLYQVFHETLSKKEKLRVVPFSRACETGWADYKFPRDPIAELKIMLLKVVEAVKEGKQGKFFHASELKFIDFLQQPVSLQHRAVIQYKNDRNHLDGMFLVLNP